MNIFLVVKKTQSRKVHPNDIKSAHLTAEEATEAAVFRTRVEDTDYVIEPVVLYGFEPRAEAVT